ncbi:MAG: terminase family protein, partial [Firmicutes bacterium]|nr:terminase family protein [Bacillota bacterium]
MSLSDKQKEYVRCAKSRWNIKYGATRSGKTYLDYFIIPLRIRAVAERDGLILLLGNTRGTLTRNIIEPLQGLWGEALVGNIRYDGTAELFGQKCYCLGADSIAQVNKLRGASVKYCYGDEITTWNPEVFEMLKSRLDKPYSRFDGTCNPEAPTHWFKKFLDSDADIFKQHYSIDDNPFLHPTFVENLKREYAGTVYYNRYILGRWAAAEGSVYPLFAEDPGRFVIKNAPPVIYAAIRVDFGGKYSATA